MSDIADLVLRPATSDEEACDAILPIAEAEDSWLVDKNTLSAYRKFDPQGVIVALVDSKPVGCVVAPAWDSKTGAILLLGVHEEHRNKGIATELGKAAIAGIRARKVTSICITSLPSSVSTYEKQGFRTSGPAIQYWSFRGSLASFTQQNKVTDKPPTASELTKMDFEYTGLDRQPVWQFFIDQKTRFFSIYSGSRLVAWTTMQFFGQQSTIAPIYAETSGQARDLVLEALKMIGESELVVEAHVTEKSEALFSELGFEKTSIKAVYMWNGMPKLPDEKAVYAGLQGF